MFFNLNKIKTTKIIKNKLFAIILFICLFKSFTNSKPLNKEETQQIIPSNLNINQQLHFLQDSSFPPSKYISKRRSAEFINGLLSLERLNSMGKRSIATPLFWESTYF
ncbi:unnamed protein product [Meloidogyne enterolobii]|uniref:Uncharacterized protein n=1 Tax=Meloidogyne enterolobii TaxID=390850 RepID=A0ACB0YY35_MELEN